MATIDPLAFSEQIEQLKAQLFNQDHQYILAENASQGDQTGLSHEVSNFMTSNRKNVDVPPGFAQAKNVEIPPGFGQAANVDIPPGFAPTRQRQTAAYYEPEAASSVPEYVPEHINGMFDTNDQEGYSPSFDTDGGQEQQGFFSKRYRDEEEIIKWPGWPGENVFRLIVPLQKVGGIIGRKGEFVKKICDETKARIKVLDGVPGATERIVMVSAKEEPDAKLSPAMDALLKVHARMDAETDVMMTGSAASRLLVAATQAGSLIGRQGATIKSIQDATGAMVRVLPSEDMPAYALQDDRIVEIHGDPRKVHHAMELVISHLRKFLVDRSVLPLFEYNRSTTETQNVPVPSNGNSTHALQQETLDKSVSVTPAAPASPTPTQQVTQHMQIPLSYADAIIGTSGANISYMRRHSGATITVSETPSVPGEMTVEVQGTTPQVQAAQQMIEAFLAQYAAYYSNSASDAGYGYATGFGF